MEAKLKKESGGAYTLVLDNPKEYPSPLPFLSIKNCQAIERGYDLDELAKREYLDGYDNTYLCRITFKDGFQKALELMGDKKFSEKDVILIAEYIRVASQSTPSVKTKDLFDEYQSLQQTEWDVTFNPEELDADGCLILKRI
jgi:hypothetical protein